MTDALTIQLGANAATLTPSLKAAEKISREIGSGQSDINRSIETVYNLDRTTNRRGI